MDLCKYLSENQCLDLAEINVYTGSTEFNSTEPNYNVFLSSRDNDVTMGGTEDVSMGGVDTPRSNASTPSSSRMSDTGDYSSTTPITGYTPAVPTRLGRVPAEVRAPNTIISVEE